MYRLLTLSLATMFCLLPACSSLPTNAEVSGWKDQFSKGLATVSTRLEQLDKGAAVVEAKVVEMRASLEAKADAAFAKAEALGAPTGSAGEFGKWVVQNPGLASTLGGGPIATILGALFVGYKRAKKEREDIAAKADTQEKALKATVDTVNALNPTAAAEFKTLAASSPHMTPEVRGLITAIDNR